MRLLTSLSSWTPLCSGSSPVITLGNFDGVHRGHQKLLGALQTTPPCERIALTFTNSPIELLHQVCPPAIMPLAVRIDALAVWLDTLIALPFTHALSELSAKQFLHMLFEHIPIAKLVLGANATVGRNREGTRSHMEALAKEFAIEMIFLDPVRYGDEIICSSFIRTLITSGRLKEACDCLGRPFKLYGKVQRGSGRARELGWPTLNICLQGYVHPPLGVYAVQCKIQDIQYHGVANLGCAPTLRNALPALLEIHLFNFDQRVYGLPVEVEFLHFIRSERRFDSIDALKDQIKIDVHVASNLLINCN